jgi:hypothetical protein
MTRSSRSFAQDITKPDRKPMIDPAIFEGVSWRNSGYAGFPASPGFTGPPGIFSDFAFPAGSSGFAGPPGVFPGFPGFPGFPTDAPGFTESRIGPPGFSGSPGVFPGTPGSTTSRFPGTPIGASPRNYQNDLANGWYEPEYLAKVEEVRRHRNWPQREGPSHWGWGNRSGWEPVQQRQLASTPGSQPLGLGEQEWVGTCSLAIGLNQPVTGWLQLTAPV